MHSPGEAPVDLGDDAAGFEERGDLDLRGGKVTDDGAVGQERVDDRRQHACVTIVAAIASVPIEKTGLRAAAMRR